jgi:hypothetical protein
MVVFTSITQLNAWLALKQIDTALWGSGGAKSVENLWSELMAGDSELQDDPPLRLVRLVNVLIRSGDKILIEVGQQFGQNQQRYRDTPPAEKMKPAETPPAAALRCLQEELQVLPDQVQLGAVSERESHLGESPSYPGLPTCYLIYEVEATVAGLPTSEFWTIEAEHADGDPVKNHHWQWISKK